MQALKTLLFLCLGHFVFGQNPKIEYQPTFIDPCTNQEVGGLPYHIKQLAADTILDRDKFELDRYMDWPEITVLPDTGWYQIYFKNDGLIVRQDEEYSRLVHINKFKPSYDTFYLGAIKHIHWVSTPPYSEYHYCDSICNGYYVTHYYNGNKKIEGTFQKGQAIDTVIYYYPDGQLKELRIPDSLGNKWIQYYSNGQIQEFNDYHTKNYWTYYKNGQLKEYRSYTGKFKKVTQYYSNGQVKSKIRKRRRKAYYKHGKLAIRARTHQSWAWGKFLKKDPSWWYTHIRFFNKKHQLKLSIELGNMGPTLELSPQNFDEVLFHEIILYKNNHPFQKIELEDQPLGGEMHESILIYQKEENDWKLIRNEPTENLYEQLSVYLPPAFVELVQ